MIITGCNAYNNSSDVTQLIRHCEIFATGIVWNVEGSGQKEIPAAFNHTAYLIGDSPSEHRN